MRRDGSFEQGTAIFGAIVWVRKFFWKQSVVWTGRATARHQSSTRYVLGIVRYTQM